MPNPSLADIRTDYKKASLNEKDVAEDPFSQFNKWFEEVLHSEVTESNAMTLATVGKTGLPSARVVLLKGVEEQGFYFYTNYSSQKAKELADNPQAALVFFWKELQRQVRIQGTVTKATEEQSDRYFLSRPRGSQLGAWSSPQSQPIASRDFLEKKVRETTIRFEKEPLYRPAFWGGYCLYPLTVEFWQGRPNRLHDRIVYTRAANGNWEIQRLAP